MKYFLGTEEINFSEKELLDSYINEGTEGITYKYKNSAIKIYSNTYPYKPKLSEEEIFRMSKIPTKRILMPEKPLYDEKMNLAGCSTKYQIEAPKDRISYITMGEFIRELEIIKQDAILLSKFKVMLEDLSIGNLLMTQEGIYLCDPGSYYFDESKSELDVLDYNFTELNFYFTRVLFDRYMKLTKKYQNILEKYFEPSTDFFLDKLKQEDISKKIKTRTFFTNFTKTL